MEDIHWLNDFATSGLEPDLNILLDLSPDLSLDRQKHRFQSTGQSADRFESEKIDFHQRVRQGYLDVAKENPNKWCVIDATISIDNSFEQLMAELKKRTWL
jgi:dTMP kinase